MKFEYDSSTVLLASIQTDRSFGRTTRNVGLDQVPVVRKVAVRPSRVECRQAKQTKQLNQAIRELCPSQSHRRFLSRFRQKKQNKSHLVALKVSGLCDNRVKKRPFTIRSMRRSALWRHAFKSNGRRSCWQMSADPVLRWFANHGNRTRRLCRAKGNTRQEMLNSGG